ncbi:MAG TPA: ABC transporter ATP-binding protein [Actinomycetes bacterium]|nr:ABC transporter ATP-binding protein [Actinomycetes bacterium]
MSPNDQPGAGLELSGISMSFVARPGDRPHAVLDGIDLTVAPGEFVTILGPSGCGKTTLLRIVNGLLRPDRGKVRVGGRVVTRPGADQAFVFQEDLLLPWRTVRANVLFPLQLRRQRDAYAVQRGRELLNVCGLAGFERHYPHELSLGMRQRVNLVRALVTEPRLLLLDEPFASVDAQTREILQEELLRIWSTFKTTMLFVTHQIDEAVYLSDRVVVLSAKPARVREIVRIELGRPRPLRLKRSDDLSRYVNRIWDLVFDEKRSQVER